jgi:hypothetical protein
VHPASAAWLHTSQNLSLQGSSSMAATYFWMHMSKSMIVFFIFTYLLENFFFYLDTANTSV